MNEELTKNILEILVSKKLTFNEILSSLEVDENTLEKYLNFLLNKKYIQTSLPTNSNSKLKITSKGKEALTLKRRYATDFNFGINLGVFKAEIKRRQIMQ